MAQFPVSTSSEQSIYAALELSKNSWLLAIQVPGRDNPSLHPIIVTGLALDTPKVNKTEALIRGRFHKLALIPARSNDLYNHIRPAFPK